MTKSQDRLSGKVAVVLGASGRGGMGEATARRLAKEGAKVVVAARRLAPLQELAREIGGEACVCDATKKPDIEALAAFAVKAFGGIDIAVYAAFKGCRSSIVDATEADIDEQLTVNYKGSFFFLQAMARAMRARGGGSIIMISTAAVRAIMENHAVYGGAKAGMEHLAQGLAVEEGKNGIRVNIIAPGLTRTEMSAGYVSVPGVVEAFAKEYPLGRIGTVDDVAAAAAWIASDECFCTGAIFEINGGLTLRRNPTYAEIEASKSQAASRASPPR